MGSKGKPKPIVFYVLGRDNKSPILSQAPLGPLAEPKEHPDQEPVPESTYDARQGKKKKTRGYFLNRYIY